MPLIDFQQYTLAVLLQAGKYEIINDFLKLFFNGKLEEEVHSLVVVYWYNLKCFHDNIEELFNFGYHGLLQNLWQLLIHRRVIVKRRLEFVSSLVVLEGGLDFVFEAIRKLHCLYLIEALFCLDFGDKNPEGYLRFLFLFSELPQPLKYSYEYYLVVFAKMRYKNEKYSEFCFPREVCGLLYSSLLAADRIEDAFSFLGRFEKLLSGHDILNISAVHRFGIENHSLYHRAVGGFSPKIVNYDFYLTLRYYRCESINDFIKS